MSNENKIDYLENIQVHQFPEDMSIYEAALETCLLAEANWAYILESTINDEYDAYETMLKEEDENTSLATEEDNANLKPSFFEKCKEALKKIASYISGMFSKFVVAMGNIIHKNAFLTSKEAQTRMENGVENIKDAPVEDKTFSGFILDQDALQVLHTNMKGIDELVKKIGNYEFLNGINAIQDVKEHLDNGFNACCIGLVSDSGMKEVIEKNKDSKDALKKNLTAMLSYNKGMDNGKDEELKYTIDKHVYNTCLDNFQKSKYITSEAKSFYTSSKTTLNLAIKAVDLAKNYTINDKEESDDAESKKTKRAYKDQCAKMAVETINKIGKLLARTNGIVLTLLKQDYTTCCKVLLKLYNAGKSSKKAAEPSPATESVDVFGYESIESIFGTTAYI